MKNSINQKLDHRFSRYGWASTPGTVLLYNSLGSTGTIRLVRLVQFAWLALYNSLVKPGRGTPRYARSVSAES
ncbi:hypothetical protein BpHYR1_044277 [Brachionus plicatilis]|uniref:Uncharacterized protein n=1 Tax=Brachionus plicatilis TaxID=10195 RepID=A0A3M7PKI5_BRAPC|nr:hypothetical protein BpHYR1_044277 [Brachionus plicatilis]